MGHGGRGQGMGYGRGYRRGEGRGGKIFFFFVREKFCRRRRV